jgi:hypothetical protein
MITHDYLTPEERFWLADQRRDARRRLTATVAAVAAALSVLAFLARRAWRDT